MLAGEARVETPPSPEVSDALCVTDLDDASGHVVVAGERGHPRSGRCSSRRGRPLGSSLLRQVPLVRGSIFNGVVVAGYATLEATGRTLTFCGLVLVVEVLTTTRGARCQWPHCLRWLDNAGGENRAINSRARFSTRRGKYKAAPVPGSPPSSAYPCSNCCLHASRLFPGTQFPDGPRDRPRTASDCPKRRGWECHPGAMRCNREGACPASHCRRHPLASY